MIAQGALLGILTEGYIHPGSGINTEDIDLPIQRDVHTSFPIIQGSGMKGALRAKAEKTGGINQAEVVKVFGPGDASQGGALTVVEARILAFPVRALSHVFVWVTCPMVLDRLMRDLAMLGLSIDGLNAGCPAKNEAKVLSDSAEFDVRLVVEELDFTVKKDLNAAFAKGFAGFIPDEPVYKGIRDKMLKHLVLVPDDDFKYLVKNATQVTARNVLNDETKQSENLWYEESLPPDTLMYSMLLHDKTAGEGAIDIVQWAKDNLCGYLQVGGNETVGMGWCRLHMYGPHTKVAG